MFDEELKEEIINCFKDRGCVFDYEEEMAKDEYGNDEKNLHFKTEINDTEFESRAVITNYTDAFSGLLYYAYFDQFLHESIDLHSAPELLKKINSINGYIGNFGCCCYTYEQEQCAKLRMYGHTFLPNDTRYRGFLLTFIDIVNASASNLLNTLIG